MTIETSSKSQTLASFCQNDSFTKTKVALLTFYKIQYPVWVEKLILIFEYLQLMSQALLASSLLDKDLNQSSYFFQIITYAFKLVNPSYLLSYESSDSMTLTVLVILFWCTLLKILLLANVIYVSSRNKKMNSWLNLLWRWTFKLQNRILYFLFTSFWVRAMIETQEREFGPFGMGKVRVLFLSSLVLAAEVLFSLALETQLCCFLPTKSFLSSKNNELELMTFLQKFIIQILMIAIQSDSEGLAWTTCLVGIIIGIIQYSEFFVKLPLYHFKALVWQGGLLATVLSLNVAYFVNNVLRASGYGVVGLNFVIITWILLALLTNKISYEALKIQILSFVSEKNHRRQTPEILLHKVIATQELKKNETIPVAPSSDFPLSHLVSINQNLNIQEIFGLPLDDLLSAKLDHTGNTFHEEMMNKVYLLYCQELLQRFPKNFLIKLHTAYRSFKNSEPYTKPLKILTEMRENIWSKNYLSCSLLLYDIERSVLASYKENEQSLNLLAYMKSRMSMDDLRSKMMTQTDLHLKVCHNIVSEVSNFGHIHSSAQEIGKLKVSIEKRINKLSERLPENYISPFLIYAEYYLVANHSAVDFRKYYEIYTRKCIKVQKFMKELTLKQENLYQDSNAFLLISTQRAEYGKILYCNKSLVELCGGQNITTYQGSDVSLLFPRFLNVYYAELYRKTELTRGQEFMNKVHRAYVFNKDNYIVEVDFCLRYHPYLAQGLCLNMIIRPVPMTENTGFLLLTENGDIMGASKEVSKLLNLNQSSSMIPIKAISEQLSLVNSAFNMTLKNEPVVIDIPETPSSRRQYSPQKTKFSDYNKVNELYRAFTSGDQQIQLYPYEAGSPEGGKPYTFSSRVQVLSFGSIQIKRVSLRLIKTRRNQYSKLSFAKMPEILSKEEDVEEDYFQPTSTNRNQTTRYDFKASSLIPTSPEGSTPLLTERPLKEGKTVETVGSSRFQTTRYDFKAATLLPTSPEGSTPLLTEKRKTTETIASPVDLVKKMLPETVVSVSEFDGPEEDNQIEQYFNKRPKHVSSQSSPLKSIEKAENRVFRSAILSKSYPRSFIWLCFVFYLVLALTFGSQTLMKSISDRTMKDLQARKDLLKDSEERVYKGALIQINARGISDQFAGIIKAGGVYSSLSTVIANLQIRLNAMREANTKMLDVLDSLDEETQKQLFVADIRMDGSYLDSTDTSYHYLNAFKVTDETTMAVKMLKNMNITTALYPAVKQVFNYLALNLVDDFLTKSKEITDILTSSVEDKKETFQYIANLFLILNPILLVGIGVLLTGIIWNQYRIENTNMKAFIKVSSKEVRIIAEKLIQFKKDLVNEETFEKRWVSRTSHSSIEKSSLNERISVYSKSIGNHQIQYKEFRRRYYNYVSRVIVSISILVGITIWDLVITQNGIKVIYNRQSQLQFANYISNRITVTSITYAQLFFTNNTVKVEGHYPLDSLPVLNELTKKIQSEIPQKFLEVDGTYNPAVQNIIYVDDPECKGWSPDFLLYCKTLVSQGQPVNMIVAMAAFQKTIAIKIQDYINANKSTLAQVLAAETITATPLPNFIAIAEEAHRIANIMDGSMTHKINEIQDEKETIIVVFSMGLLVVGVLIWFYILRVIREVYNDFKKVLQTLPVNLVLSSYLLKRFLQQSSGNALLK